MRYDWLFEPISETEPCGPDLDDAGDDGYLNYVLAVSSRIPERFYRPDGTPFDRNELKLKDEVEAIGGLLKQTRDLRLLSIEARFQSFAGELSGFADCLDACAGLVERFWADVHPKDYEGDFTLRQNGLSGLDDFGQVIQPLQYAPLVRDRRLGPISFRQFMIASGAVQKREEETVPDIGEIHRAIAADENRAMSDLGHDAAARAASALARTRQAFIEQSGYDYVPSFDRLSDFLKQLLDLFHASRPELAATARAGIDERGVDEVASSAAAADGVQVAAPPSGLIGSHSDVAAALLAVEEYLAAHEPSAPALILVHQARALVGKPLIHALETLLPEAAPRAMITLQGEVSMKLNMERLKELTADLPGLANGGNGADPTARTFSATTRAEAMTLMAEVEHFYKHAEPSSPIPTLLAKASGYSNRDFVAILRDLIPPVAEE
jgi:type VI secretion system protein ImpA